MSVKSKKSCAPAHSGAIRRFESMNDSLISATTIIQQETSYYSFVAQSEKSRVVIYRYCIGKLINKLRSHLEFTRHIPSIFLFCGILRILCWINGDASCMCRLIYHGTAMNKQQSRKGVFIDRFVMVAVLRGCWSEPSLKAIRVRL